jgi:hypothetical protein
MDAPSVSTIEETAEAVRKYKSIRAAARALGLPPTTVQHRLERARQLWPGRYPTKSEHAEMALLDALKTRSGNVADIAQRVGMDPDAVRNTLRSMAERGVAIHERGDHWDFNTTPPIGSAGDNIPELSADHKGMVEFAAIGDTHLCSKYERLDCLGDFYDEVARRGIRHVLHAGNWIDGEAVFNRHDLLVPAGIDSQMRYLAENYPRRTGIETWAITGADHEGWYARTAGVDVGRYAERAMQDAGRTDWRNLGYMESYVRLRHPVSGQSSMLLLMHPGGGSAYAISYAPQKIVEGFDGGDKPAVLLVGHYHKASYQMTRNVHTIQVGCFQDQTVFMRQKKLSAHIGGMLVRLHLDPETGAVIGCGIEFRNYYNKGYYNGRWSQHGPVTLARRAAYR